MSDKPLNSPDKDPERQEPNADLSEEDRRFLESDFAKDLLASPRFRQMFDKKRSAEIARAAIWGGKIPQQKTDEALDEIKNAAHDESAEPLPQPEPTWESLTPPEQNRRNWQTVVRWATSAKTILLHPDRAWRKIGMWQVAAAIMAATIGIGVGVLSLTPPDYFIARVCFIVSEVVLLAALVQWLIVSTKNNIERLIFCVIVGGLTLFVLVQALRWVSHREETGKQDTQAKTDAMQTLIKGLGEKYTREELLKRYPLGYVIFDLEYTNTVVPRDTQLSNGYQLDWKVAGFKSITEDRYVLRLPDVLKGGQMAAANNTVTGTKQVGGPQGGIYFDDVIMWSEILAITDRGMVFLIGFDRFP